jgi:hypothetical protein
MIQEGNSKVPSNFFLLNFKDYYVLTMFLTRFLGGLHELEYIRESFIKFPPKSIYG